MLTTTNIYKNSFVVTMIPGATVAVFVYDNSVVNLQTAYTRITLTVLQAGPIGPTGLTGPALWSATGSIAPYGVPITYAQGFVGVGQGPTGASFLQTNSGGSTAGTGSSVPQYTLDVVGSERVNGARLFADGSAQVSATPALDYTTFGQNWTATSLPTGNWNTVAVSANGQYQTVGTNGAGINYSINYGQSWSVPTGINAAAIVNSIAVSASGQYQLAAVQGTYAGIYYSTNYGASWTASSASSSTWYEVCISASGQYASAVINSASTVIYYSTNYGQTWIASMSPSSQYTTISCSASGQYQVAATGVGTVYYSSTYGQSWSASNMSTVGSLQDSAMSASGQYVSIATNAVGVWYSSNYGQTFVQVTAVIGTFNLRQIAMNASGQYQLVAGYTGGMYYSINYGVNWTQGSSSVAWYSVAISPNGQYCIGCIYNGLVYLSVTRSPSLYTSGPITVSGTITSDQFIGRVATSNALASVALTATSQCYQLVTGSTATAFTLPNATTCTIGIQFTFNNNTSAQSITVQNFTTGTILSTIPTGAITTIICITNASADGTWDVHSYLPVGATFGSSALSYAGNLLLTGSAAKTIGTSGTGNLTIASNSTGLLTLNSAGGTLAFQSGGVTYASVGTTGVSTQAINAISSSTDIQIGYQNIAGSSGYVSLGLSNVAGYYPTVSVGNAALSIGWNFSGGGGEIDFMSDYNGTGGFSFYGRPSSNTTTLMANINSTGLTLPTALTYAQAFLNSPIGQIKLSSSAISLTLGAYYTAGVGETTAIQAYDGSSGAQPLYINGNGGSVLIGGGYAQSTFGSNTAIRSTGITYFDINGANKAYIDTNGFALRGSLYMTYGSVTLYYNPANNNTWSVYSNSSAQWVVGQSGGYNMYLPSGVASTTWSNNSDERLKTNINLVPSIIPSLMQLKVKSFNYLSNPDAPLSIGFIAQDIQKIPELSSMVSDGIGEAPDGSKYLGVNQSVLIPYLVKGMQEQQAQIKIQAAQIATLQQQVVSLLAQLK
jgi:hypothetical protein